MPTETLRADVWVMATRAAAAKASAEETPGAVIDGNWSLLRYPSTDPTAERFPPWYLFDASNAIHWHEIPIVLGDDGVRPKTMREVRDFAARKIPVADRDGKAWIYMPKLYTITPEPPDDPYRVRMTWTLTRAGHAITAIKVGPPVST